MRLGVHFPTAALQKTSAPARVAPRPWPFPAAPALTLAPAPETSLRASSDAQSKTPAIEELVHLARAVGAI